MPKRKPTPAQLAYRRRGRSPHAKVLVSARLTPPTFAKVQAAGGLAVVVEGWAKGRKA